MLKIDFNLGINTQAHKFGTKMLTTWRWAGGFVNEANQDVGKRGRRFSGSKRSTVCVLARVASCGQSCETLHVLERIKASTKSTLVSSYLFQCFSSYLIFAERGLLLKKKKSNMLCSWSLWTITTNFISVSKLGNELLFFFFSIIFAQPRLDRER